LSEGKPKKPVKCEMKCVLLGDVDTSQKSNMATQTEISTIVNPYWF